MSSVVGGGIVGSGFVPKQGVYEVGGGTLALGFGLESYNILQEGSTVNNRKWSDVITLNGQFIVENLSVSSKFVSLRILDVVDDSVLYEFINDKFDPTPETFVAAFGQSDVQRWAGSSVLLSNVKIQVSRLSGSGISRIYVKAWEL